MQAAYSSPLIRSSIGKKAIMALTGLIGIGFVFFHMYGNLKIFLGAAYFNEYAEGLRELGAPIFGHTHILWVLRIVLLASVVLHVWAAVSLYRQAKKARSTNYAVKRTVAANYASKTIRWGGLVIFLFVIFHLMHFTWGTPGIHPDFVYGDPYHNVIVGFQFWPATLFYLLAVVALGFHLYHGTWSMIQTLGFLSSRYDTAVRFFALALAIIIAGGFSLVPLAVMFGIVA